MRPGSLLSRFVLEVPVDKENALPECYVENGTMLIFTNGSNKDGWYADKDTILQLDFGKLPESLTEALPPRPTNSLSMKKISLL